VAECCLEYRIVRIRHVHRKIAIALPLGVEGIPKL